MREFRVRIGLFGSVFLAVLALSWRASAHELWISPVDYAASPGGRLVADIRVGEKFSGSAYSYIPDDFVRFEIHQGGERTEVEGRMGDQPALDIPAPGEGLAVVVYQTTPGILFYDKPEMFRAFVEHKDLRGAIEAHEARGLPPSNFREAFRRFAKSLIRVGHGRGQDREFGLETEIVAEKNPYTDDISGGLPVRVLYQGKPRADVQVEIFTKPAGGAVEITTQRTDASGRTVIPVAPGTEYLLDAVVLRPLVKAGAKNDPVWESLWASLTFKTP